RRSGALLMLISVGLLCNGCTGSEQDDSNVAATEQHVIAVSPPNDPGSSFFLDHPANLFEEIDIWCGNNQSGRRPQLGVESNPCALMCDTRLGFITSTANLATSLIADVVGAVPSATQAQIAANLMACGVDAWATQQLVTDPWCAQNPVQCGIGIAPNVACCI